MKKCSAWLLTMALAVPPALLPVAARSAPDPAVDRMARALQFRTISHQDRDQIDYREFDRFNAFLRDSFPRVFSELQVESVNDYSLLIRWPGSDASYSSARTCSAG